jgi:hypothetical protein
MSYITHIGVIYRKDKHSKPIFVESFNPYDKKQYHPDVLKSGIAVCDLENRINSYRGYIIYKELEKPISEHANIDFLDFIKYAKKHMEYDEFVIRNEIEKIFCNTPFANQTNCGQFTELILMKTGLLPMDNFTNRRKHHLMYTSSLTKVQNNEYKTPIFVCPNYYHPVEIDDLMALNDNLIHSLDTLENKVDLLENEIQDLKFEQIEEKKEIKETQEITKSIKDINKSKSETENRKVDTEGIETTRTLNKNKKVRFEDEFDILGN